MSKMDNIREITIRNYQIWIDIQRLIYMYLYLYIKIYTLKYIMIFFIIYTQWIMADMNDKHSSFIASWSTFIWRTNVNHEFMT